MKTKLNLKPVKLLFIIIIIIIILMRFRYQEVVFK